MSNRSSLSDIAVRMLAKIEDVERTIAGINDYGDPTCICEEWDRLYRDAEYALGSLINRARLLSKRAEAVNQARGAK